MTEIMQYLEVEQGSWASTSTLALDVEWMPSPPPPRAARRRRVMTWIAVLTAAALTAAALVVWWLEVHG